MAAKKEALKKKKRMNVDSPEFHRWEKRGDVLGAAKNSNQWAIADWILDGMNRFEKSDVYDRVQKLTGLTRDTLKQFKLTAERFPTKLTRVNGLSFGHHRLVAKYDEEDRRRLLKHAKETEESVASFAAYLRQEDADAARRADKRPHADRAADKVIDACDAVRKCSAFVTLLSKQPTPEKRSELLDGLRAVIADLTSKVERFERLWVSSEQAMKAGAGK